MFGTAFAWLFLTGLGVLIAKVVLRNPKLDEEKKKQAFFLALGACVFLLFTGFLSYRISTWASAYGEEPLANLGELAPDEDYWGLLEAKVSPTSDLAEKDKGYVTYFRFKRQQGKDAKVEQKWGERNIKLEFSDGKILDLDRSFGVPQKTWNWNDQGEFRFLKHDDNLLVYGHVYPVTSNKEGVTHGLSDVEFIYRGSASEFKESYLSTAGKASGPINLVVAVLCLISSIGILVLALSAKKAKPQES